MARPATSTRVSSDLEKSRCRHPAGGANGWFLVGLLGPGPVVAAGRVLEADAFDGMDEVRQKAAKHRRCETKIDGHRAKEIEDQRHRAQRISEETVLIDHCSFFTHDQFVADQPMNGRRQEVSTGFGGFGTETRANVHCDGVFARSLDMNAGGNSMISQPKVLQQAGCPAKARIDLEMNVMATNNVFRNERNAREGVMLARDEVCIGTSWLRCQRDSGPDEKSCGFCKIWASVEAQESKSFAPGGRGQQ